ncbi:hypothetical protein GCM10011588_50800 [Nocardia jinanensis]|uniref:Uncharacterized protein n=1 Tax=Nocardia jinanensis TaxID=382504 RepID=A0A917RUF4_9NOCA|nr:hypothetical protein GCM10011588_50800 [Nocardia jinanensis]
MIGEQGRRTVDIDVQVDQIHAVRSKKHPQQPRQHGDPERYQGQAKRYEPPNIGPGAAGLSQYTSFRVGPGRRPDPVLRGASAGFSGPEYINPTVFRAIASLECARRRPRQTVRTGSGNHRATNVSQVYIRLNFHISHLRY